jgi:hypothetical protein
MFENIIWNTIHSIEFIQTTKIKDEKFFRPVKTIKF